MATKIVTKNSSTAGAAPTATDLVQGELAVNVADKRLFTEDNGGSIVELGTNPYNFTANHDGSAKLATTATGINVTGTATMDGLVVDGAGDGVKATIGKTGGTNLNIYADTNTVYLAGSPALSTAYIIDQTNNNMQFKVNAAERMRIDSSGNVGIGTSSPTTRLDVRGGVNSAHATFTGQASRGLVISTANTLSNDDGVVYNAQTVGSGKHIFQTGATERMRIDSSGNVLVGKSSDSFGTQGVAFRGSPDVGASGSIFTRDGENVAAFNRLNSDGSILTLNKNGTAVGSIGTLVSSLTIGSGDTGLILQPAYDRILPFNVSTNAGRDNAIDLGASGSRFKDLYLSGTASATSVTSAQHLTAGSAYSLLFGDGGERISGNNSSSLLNFFTGATERMRIDGSGNLLVGTTSTAVSSSTGSVTGTVVNNSGLFEAAKTGTVMELNRLTADGAILKLRKDGTVVGSIGTNGSSRLYIASGDTGLDFESGTDAIRPCSGSGGARDNAIDLGRPDVRFDDIYATNGTIQTSDRNEKQDIAELSDAEQRVAVACKGLLRKFRWKDSVAEKGDDARIHFGIIAQDLQAAFAAEGLDAGDYAMFISTTWTDEETNEEKTRLGVRYSELLAFIISAL